MALQRVISWAHIAERDLDAIEDYIALDKPQAALDAVNTIEAKVQMLKGIPINPFFGRIASLRRARNPHVRLCTFRLLRAARLALHPENSYL